MTAEQLFKLCNLAAMAGWLMLVFAGRARWAARLVTGMLIPALLAVVYVAVLGLHWGESKGGFGTLEAVTLLFTNRWLVLGGWVHYLAFDLFIGSWEVRDSARLGISHLLVIPCLLLTFLFGPAGLLCYLVLRTMRVRAGIEC
jgi:ABA DEFICIENT 4-like